MNADRAKCGTLDHIYLSYLRDGGVAGQRVTWLQVARDGWFGIVVWSLAAVLALVLAGPPWLLFVLCLYFAVSVSVFVIRLLMGHRFGCAARYGFHWPLQFAELI